MARIIASTLIMLAFLSSFALAFDEAEAPANLREPAQGTISSQMNAFQSQEHERAFGYASPDLQKLFGSTDRFIGMVKNGYGAIYGARGFSFGRSRLKDGLLYQELLVTGPDGREWLALYTMTQLADGTWRIAGVQLVPGAGHST